MRARACCIAGALTVATSSAAALNISKPFVSVNVVDAWWQYIGEVQGSRAESIAHMSDACTAAGFTFIRVSATSYWPDIMRDTWFTNRTAYLDLFDVFVADAEAAGCTLLLDLFWNTFLFADAVGEPLGAITDLSKPSVGRAAMLDFATAMVGRYARNRTVAGWEFGNEWNLLVDLNMTAQQPNIAPGRGTPAARTAADNFSTDGLVGLLETVTTAIAAADPLHRPISSGMAMPRPFATALRAVYYDDPQPPLGSLPNDTVAQFYAIAAAHNTGCSWMSMHMYAGNGQTRWNITDPDSADMVAYALQAARLAGQQLYLGEFGDPVPGNRTFTRNMLAAMNDSGVAAGTVWIWEFYQQGPTAPAAAYSLLPERDASIVAAMQAWNAAHQSA